MRNDKLLPMIVTLVSLLLTMMLPAEARNNGSAKIPYPGGKHYMYRLTLTDKRPSIHMMSNPLSFLSAKALERRRRQGISVDTLDVPVAQQYVDEVEKLPGMKVVSRSRWSNTIVVRTKDAAATGRLSQLPFVSDVRMVWVSPDSIVANPPRPKYHTEIEQRDTSIHASHGVAQPQLEMVGGVKLHERGFRGQGMTIAVMDAGFLNADLIPAFRDINLVGYADFVVPQSRSIFAEMEHGANVLSILAINKPGVYVGAAPDAAYWLLRCEDQQSEQPVEEDYWAAAAEFADSAGVDVISCSLGFNIYDKPFTNYYSYWQQDGRTALISRMASTVASRGMVLVNSAGNNGQDPWKKIGFPADARDMLCVGAVTPERRNASFSSVGPSADGRVKPDVMAQGSPTNILSERGTLTSVMGTSFSCPIVAGLTACLWQEHREMTAMQIIDLVRSLGDNFSHPDNVYGYGVPDFSK